MVILQKNNPKLNDGRIKIFKLLLLLYQDKADYESVKDIFKNDFDDEQSTNNIQVVLNKYLNTLKVFGINVKKVNNQYKLLNNLYAMNFSEDDLKSINILSKNPSNRSARLCGTSLVTKALDMPNTSRFFNSALALELLISFATSTPFP